LGTDDNLIEVEVSGGDYGGRKRCKWCYCCANDDEGLVTIMVDI